MYRSLLLGVRESHVFWADQLVDHQGHISYREAQTSVGCMIFMACGA